jgi:Na+/proline symporter
VSALIFVGGIAWYTARGGLQTLIWTDVYQTSVFLLGASTAFGYLVTALEPVSITQTIGESRYGQLFFWDSSLPNYFWKQFLGGALITICMTGLDQDMMQKNLTIARLDNAQRNMLVYGFLLVAVNLLFVSLGALLYLFVDSGLTGLSEPVTGDRLLPTVANEVFPPVVSMLVVMGLVAAALNSIDGTLPALTTAVCLNLLPVTTLAQGKDEPAETTELAHRNRVHWVLAGILALCVVGFYRYLQSDERPTLNVISLVLGMATFTYGPLLGFFLFGLTNHRQIAPRALWLVASLMPILTWVLKEQLKGIYTFGYELLAFNAALSYALLWMSSKRMLTKTTL